MEPMTQKELIAQLKCGHQASFAVLYNHYGKRIYHLAYRMLGNKEEAEDATQETFLQVYRHIAHFNEQSQLYTWIYQIAKNLCYRTVQRQKKSRFTSLEALLYTARNQAMPSDITQQEKLHLIQQVKEGCLTGLLRCLSFYQRSAFILHVLLHLPIQDVADILEKSNGATKVLIHRARGNLKTFLCKHCSLYSQSNSCQCDGLLGFSLKQGWVTRPSAEELHNFPELHPQKIEEELVDIRRLTELYTSVSPPNAPEELRRQIQSLIKNQEWTIFSAQKV